MSYSEPSTVSGADRWTSDLWGTIRSNFIQHEQEIGDLTNFVPTTQISFVPTGSMNKTWQAMEVDAANPQHNRQNWTTTATSVTTPSDSGTDLIKVWGLIAIDVNSGTYVPYGLRQMSSLGTVEIGITWSQFAEKWTATTPANQLTAAAGTISGASSRVCFHGMFPHPAGEEIKLYHTAGTAAYDSGSRLAIFGEIVSYTLLRNYS